MLIKAQSLTWWGEAFSTQRKNYSFRAILRCPEIWSQTWTLWIFPQSKISFDTLFSHLQPHWVILCTQNKGNSFCLDEGWISSQTRWHMSQVLKDAQEPSRMEILFPGAESIMGKNTRGHEGTCARERIWHRLVCLCMRLKFRKSASI